MVKVVKKKPLLLPAGEKYRRPPMSLVSALSLEFLPDKWILRGRMPSGVTKKEVELARKEIKIVREIYPKFMRQEWFRPREKQEAAVNEHIRALERIAVQVTSLSSDLKGGKTALGHIKKILETEKGPAKKQLLYDQKEIIKEMRRDGRELAKLISEAELIKSVTAYKLTRRMVDILQKPEAAEVLKQARMDPRIPIESVEEKLLRDPEYIETMWLTKKLDKALMRINQIRAQKVQKVIA